MPGSAFLQLDMLPGFGDKTLYVGQNSLASVSTKKRGRGIEQELAQTYSSGAVSCWPWHILRGHFTATEGADRKPASNKKLPKDQKQTCMEVSIYDSVPFEIGGPSESQIGRAHV